MELKVKEITLPEALTFNYEELKAELTAKAEHYESLVFTSDQLPEAKAERAKLNALKKALNDERLRLEKEYMQPFNDFKAKINEIIGIIDRPTQAIDSQVKSFEANQKAEKKEKIEAYFVGRNPFEWLKLEQIFNEKWLNASAKMPNVTGEIDSRIEGITKDLETLQNLPEFGFEATEEYKQSLDLNKAIAEGHRLSEIQKKKAEAEAEMKKAKVTATVNVKGQKTPIAEIPVEVTQRTWISFKARLTVEDATALKDFFEDRSIEFERI